MKDFILLFLASLLYTLSLEAQMVTSWKRTIRIGNTGVYKQRLANYGKNHYVVIDGTTAWGDQVEEANKILYSSDGGNTWEVILKDRHWNMDENFEQLPGKWRVRYFHAIDIATPDNIYLIGNEDLTDDNTDDLYPFIYKTNDGGDNWERIEICNQNVPRSRSFISMVSSSYGFIYTADCSDKLVAKIYYTEDGFETMVPLESPKEDLYPIFFEAIDENKLIIGTRDNILITNNKGISWEINDSPDDVTSYNFVDINIGYATSSESTGLGNQKKGNIYKTTNGGTDWQLIFEEDQINYQLGLDDIGFLNEDQGIAIGTMKIYTTSDAGKTWKLNDLPFEQFQEQMYSVKYVSNESAVIASNNIIHTNWELILKSPELSVNAVKPIDLVYGVSWNSIEEATSYQFQMAEYEITPYPTYAPSDDFNQSLIFEVENTNELKTEISNHLQFDRRYYLRVRAMNENDTSSWSRYQSFDTESNPDPNELTAPKLVFPANNQKNLPASQVLFAWQEVPVATKYHLSVRRDVNIHDPSTDWEIDDITSSTFILTDLEPGEEYYWFIKAFDKDNNEKTSPFRVFHTEGTNHVEVPITNKFKIYPNPANDKLFVEPGISSVSIEGITIFDAFGNVVAKVNNLGRNKFIFDVDLLPSGTYFMEITNNQSSYIQKLIIDK